MLVEKLRNTRASRGCDTSGDAGRSPAKFRSNQGRKQLDSVGNSLLVRYWHGGDKEVLTHSNSRLPSVAFI